MITDEIRYFDQEDSEVTDMESQMEIVGIPCVGGKEGRKLLVRVNGVIYFAKEYLRIDCDDIETIADNYQVLQFQGFFVPPEAFTLSENDKVYLVMTDMTDNGEYLVWGFNNSPHPAEIEQLRMMNLNSEDYESIKEQVAEIVSLGKKYDYDIKDYFYHLRRPINGGPIEVFLLDISLYLQRFLPDENINDKNAAHLLDIISEESGLNKVNS